MPSHVFLFGPVIGNGSVGSVGVADPQVFRGAGSLSLLSGPEQQEQTLARSGVQYQMKRLLRCIKDRERFRGSAGGQRVFCLGSWVDEL